MLTVKKSMPLTFQLLSVFFLIACEPKVDPRMLELEQRILQEINTFRSNEEKPVLSENEKLSEVAREHSEDMSRRDYFSHDTPEGVSFDERIAKAGIAYLKAGENIYYRLNPDIENLSVAELASGVVEAWKNSSGHREIMLDADFNEAGVGCFSGGDELYVTLDVIEAP
ncbi:CAP domain-containing protein [bacterium]|nr:CAP domain-containing protein [bacterium]